MLGLKNIDVYAFGIFHSRNLLLQILFVAFKLISLILAGALCLSPSLYKGAAVAIIATTAITLSPETVNLDSEVLSAG